MAVTTRNPATLARQDQPIVAPGPQLVLTTTRQLKARESGAVIIFNSATAFTVTLPPPRKDLFFTFFVKLAASAVGHVVAVQAGVITYGKVSPSGAATAATAGKGRLNTQATSTVGDGLYMWSDGTNWYATPTGIWAEN